MVKNITIFCDFVLMALMCSLTVVHFLLGGLHIIFGYDQVIELVVGCVRCRYRSLPYCDLRHKRDITKESHSCVFDHESI